MVSSIRLSSLAAVIVVTAFFGLFTESTGQETTISENDWPCWRGPNRNGVANPNQKPPGKWSATENVLWRTAVPGLGHGSATVLGDQVFITTADLDRDCQSVICVERNTGKPIWETKVHQGGLKTPGNKKQNKKASLASTTVATDGKQLYVNFLNNEAVWTTALSLTGKQIWQQKISDYVVHQGYGSSPAIYKDLVIVSADNKGGGAIVAMQASTGQTVWRRERPKKPNYPSPVILTVAGKEQLFFTGCDLVTSLNPATGEENWEIAGATTECVSTTVTDGKNIFTSGGYPKNHISAVAADGSGKVVWENNSRNYVPSLLYHDDHLYAVLDAGIAACYSCKTGKTIWKKRLDGPFTASSVLVGNAIYTTNEKGKTFIFKAQSTKFELLAENKLGDYVFSSMVICGSRIYQRVASMEDEKRQEYLYCLGAK